MVVRGAAQADEPQPKRQIGGSQSTSLHQMREFVTDSAATTKLCLGMQLRLSSQYTILAISFAPTLVPQPQTLCSSQVGGGIHTSTWGAETIGILI